MRASWRRSGARLFLCCVLGLGGCSTAYQRAQFLAGIPENLPASIELSQTPFFPQTEYQCGPAALATVLQAHGVDVTPELLSSQLYIPERKGSLQIEMSVTARRYGMLPYPLKPALSAMLTEIAAGNPVLILQNAGFDWWPQWHYAVVIGYDIDENLLLLRSGTTERWETSFYTFMNTWNRAGNWALVILPAGDIPVTAEPATYLVTAYALEETGLNTNALNAYRAATKQWPDNSSAWLTLGNLAYNTGNYDEAVTALLQASTLAPDSVATWNNLAYALHGNGCTKQEQHALQCARRLAPDDRNILDSEKELRTMKTTLHGTQCPQVVCK